MRHPGSLAIPFIIVLVAMAFTLVSCQSQTDVSHGTVPGLERQRQQHVLDISDSLQGNERMSKVMKTAQSENLLQQGTTNGSFPLGSAMADILGVIPTVFNSSFFRLAMLLASDEIGNVHLSQLEQFVLYNLTLGVTQPKGIPVWSAAFNDTLNQWTVLYTMARTSWSRAASRYMQQVTDLNWLLSQTLSLSQQQQLRQSVRPRCLSDSVDFLEAIVRLVSSAVTTNSSVKLADYAWALKMLDSFGKPSGGIMKGAVNFVGSYDECIQSHAHFVNNDNSGFPSLTGTRDNHVTDFNGRYCRVTFNLPDSVIDSFGVDTHGITLRLHWGMCFPETCHSDDIQGLFHLGNLSNNVYSVFCAEDKDIGEDSSALVAVVILAVLGSAVVLCTLFEAWLIFSHNNFPPSPRSIDSSPHCSIEDPEVAHDAVTSKLAETPGLENAAFQLNENSEKNPTPAPEKANSSHSKQVELAIPVSYVPYKENLQGDLQHDSMTMSADMSSESEMKKVSPPPSYTTAAKDHRNKVEPRVPALVKAFSVVTNMPKVLSGKKSPNAIHCLHGIRLFSLLWVILGHTYNYGVINVVDNPTTVNLVDADAIFKRFTFQGIMAGGFAVDTFFMLSGLLVSWLTLKDLDKKKNGVGYWVMFYVHRFWRLTPIYMMVLMMFGCLYAYLGAGPLWPRTLDTADNCRTNWWTNLLYVNNLVGVENMCMGWTWYLANDMQFYWISPVFLLALFYAVPLGIAMTVGLVLTGIVCAFYFEYQNGGDLFTMHEDNGYWKEVYITPWSRVAAYAVGMLLGYIFYRTKRTTLKMRTALIGWLLTWAVGVFLCYIKFTSRREGGEQWARWVEALYQSLSRPLWAACVGWIIFACHNNRGGFLNTILSWQGFLPLSRLTYAAYLVHPIIMMLHVFSKKTLVYIDDFDLAYLYMGHTVTSFLTAFFFSLLAEAPALAVEKLVFRMR